MMFFKKIKTKKKKGFTLIEMVLVVVILGVLSSVALVKYDDIQAKAKEKADNATASTIITATTLAINDGKKFSSPFKAEQLSPQYIQTKPVCQTTGESFDVTIKSDGSISISSTVGGVEKFSYPKPTSN